VQLAMARRAVPVAAPASGTVVLPKTATDAELKMIAGAVLLALALILLAFNRRRALSA
jgi:Ca-activated chloride channel family protein